MKKRALLTIVLLLIAATGAMIFLSVFLPGRSTPELASEHVPTSASFALERLKMVEEQIVTRDVTNTMVLDAMRRVPRHEFVPAEEATLAYADQPLPIGYGQTISQPFIVALMTQLLELKRDDKVLEVGTGSGYQAAVLAELSDNVWTEEIIPDLADSAAARLKRLGYQRVVVRNADGYWGWEEQAPFDAIVVTAAPDHVPPFLIRQLSEGGRLVVPVGPPGSIQTLWRIIKRNGQVTSENVTGVVFVPLVGGAR
jgi:protein-L-isoaspartate(D-aspartate) O-methyltransferase